MNYKSIEVDQEKTYGSILSSLQSKLGKFDSREIAELTSTNTINFEDIGKEKTAVYVISSDTHAAYDFLLTIFFAQMIQQLYDFADENGGALPVPTFFILDEFANIGKIPDFDKKISTSRSRKISFSVILQNLDQLEAVYKEAHETIMGNCDTHLFLGSNSQKTVEYFSKALGEKTIFRESESVNKDRADWKQGKSVSEQNMARALLTPDELRRLDVDTCIIYEKGLKPIKANKYYYYKYSTAKTIAPYAVDHNNREQIDRGAWRKFNPYNPYVEKEDKEDLKIEELDDLFEETGDTSNNTNQNVNTNTEQQNQGNINQEENKMQDTPKTSFEDSLKANISQPSNQANKNVSAGSKEELTDIQKELEAKFDELFGSIEDKKEDKK